MSPSPQIASVGEEFPNELPEHYEIVCGNFVRKAVTSFPHQVTQRRLSTFVDPFHGRRGDPGGWWLATEGNVLFFLKPAKEQYRPDLVGWRISKMPNPRMRGPINVWPQWVCEILSPSTAHKDKGEKLDVYHRAHVDHYWLVDPEKQTLTVLAWGEDGYQTILTAGPGDRVRAEPFAERELDLGWLFDFE
ncbi:MAG: Uma2 family endonuclease [Proteobacteria bacterium]|nr:Uma2 family endonuclease [Pseudomonadota bacterium]